MELAWPGRQRGVGCPSRGYQFWGPRTCVCETYGINKVSKHIEAVQTCMWWGGPAGSCWLLSQGPQLGITVLLVALYQSNSHHLKLKADPPWWFITLQLHTIGEGISGALECLFCHKLQEGWEVMVKGVANYGEEYREVLPPRHVSTGVWVQLSKGELSLSQINMLVKISRGWVWENQIFIKQTLFSPWICYHLRNVLYSSLLDLQWSTNISSLPPPLVYLSTSYM